MKTLILSLTVVTLLSACSQKEKLTPAPNSDANQLSNVHSNKLNKVSGTSGNEFYKYSEISSAMQSLNASVASAPPGFVAAYNGTTAIHFWQLGSSLYTVYVFAEPDDVPSEAVNECTRKWFSQDGRCDESGNDCKVVVSGASGTLICCD